MYENEERTLVFDIETTGEEFDELDVITQKELFKGIAEQFPFDEERQAHERSMVMERLGLSPLHGEVVAIALLDVEKKKGKVGYRYSDGRAEQLDEENNFGFKCCSEGEKELLEWFWEAAKHYNVFVTFNGRAFDVPFLMARSAVYEIKPTKNLMKFRYLSQQRSYSKDAVHVDLREELGYYGAVRKAGGLHLWCRALGIESPKREDESGLEVPRMFKEHDMARAARYNVRDVVSTCELYRRWREYLDF